MNSSPGITFFFSKWRFFFIISVISAIFFSACSSTPVISAGKPSQIAAVAAISVLPVVYIAAGILPYAGDPIVSDELRNSFNMDNFFGESPIPERVKLLDCGWEAFTHRVNLISKAQQEIYFATFIFRRGTTPAIIIGALLSAADRGVRVNVIIDGKGNLMPRRYMDILASHGNINFFRFNNLNFLRPGDIPMVFHDKYMTIDNRFMILGGRNIGDRYFKPGCFLGTPAFDMEVLVYNTNPDYNGSISAVRDLFHKTINAPLTSLYQPRRRISRTWEAQKYYHIALYKTFKNSNGSLSGFDYYANTISVNKITMIYNPREGRKKEAVIAYNLLRIAYHSDDILIQSPYFTMTNRFLDIFAEASRQSDITLLTNSLASAVNPPGSSRYFANRRNILNRTNLTIYEYQDTETSIHGKSFNFDDRLTVITSFNLNMRSIQIDLETALIIDSREFNAIVRESVNSLMSRSLRVLDHRTFYPNENVMPGHVTRRKRLFYNFMGRLLVIGRLII